MEGDATKYLKALVFLQLQAFIASGAGEKPELLLNRAGFKHKEIAEILGKREDAVKKAISRARSAETEPEDNG